MNVFFFQGWGGGKKSFGLYLGIGRFTAFIMQCGANHTKTTTTSYLSTK